MPRQIPTLNLRDFTGGLNLRSDGFDLKMNESPDLMNVVLDSRGGFQYREGVRLYNSTNALPAAITGMFTFETTSGFRQLLVGAGTNVYYESSAPFSGIFTSCGIAFGSTPTRITGVQAQDKAYIFRTNAGAVYRWTGAAATSLASTFNDTGTPANSGIPQARYGAWHQGRLWVAYTTETAVDYPHRVRFSYTSNVANTMGPEDFRTADYIDIAPGGASGKIVALVPFQDRLFVFKTNGIYAILGNSSTNFQVVTISEEVGACGPDAVVATTSGIFFFDWPTGLHAISVDGSSRYLFENILPAIQSGDIQSQYQSLIALGYNARKVYVSVPYGNGVQTNTRTYVLDTAIGGGARYGVRTPIAEGRSPGAWTQYDFGVGQFLLLQYQGQDQVWVGTDPVTTGNRNRRILWLEGGGSYTNDVFATGPQQITAYYVTSWLDLGDAAVMKRWKGPVLTTMLGSNSGGSLSTQVWYYKDYDSSPSAALGTFNPTGPTAGASVAWSIPYGFGSARSVRVKLQGSGDTEPGGVQAISFPYIIRATRAPGGRN